MFNLYYQTELTYLRELGREFSEANPELADLFVERAATRTSSACSRALRS